MKKQLEEETRKENLKHSEAESLKEEYERLHEANLQHYAEAAGFQSIFEKHENLKARKVMLEDNRRHILDGMNEMTGERRSLKVFCNAENLYRNYRRAYPHAEKLRQSPEVDRGQKDQAARYQGEGGQDS